MTNVSQCVCSSVRLDELLRCDLLHLQLRCVDVAERCLQAGQQLLPLLHRGSQLLPSCLTVLLQLLETSCLQLSCALLPWQTVYQYLTIPQSIPFNISH